MTLSKLKGKFRTQSKIKNGAISKKQWRKTICKKASPQNFWLGSKTSPKLLKSKKKKKKMKNQPKVGWLIPIKYMKNKNLVHLTLLNDEVQRCGQFVM